MGGSKNKKSGNLTLNSVVGTSFYIGSGYFITAGHVLNNLVEYEMMAIGVLDENRIWQGIEIEGIEIQEDIDIGIFSANYELEVAIPWDSTLPANLTDISISGYPHGMDVTAKAIYRRDFKGYVICNRHNYDLKGKPIILELSTPCPRGISGGFVLNTISESICGIVIGSSKSELEISYVTEESTEIDGKVIYHKTESSVYGMAVSSISILNIKFEILAATLREHLINQKLIETT